MGADFRLRALVALAWIGRREDVVTMRDKLIPFSIWSDALDRLIPLVMSGRNQLSAQLTISLQLTTSLRLRLRTQQFVEHRKRHVLLCIEEVLGLVWGPE